ncbi:MAG: hypothetical protein ABIP46_01330, partial [Polaromonas sp.]
MTFRLTPHSCAQLLAAPLLLWAGTALAQTPSPAHPSVSPVGAAVPAYRSALQGYKPYTDDTIVDWKKANDTAASAGGWRAYAKEAAQAPLAEAAARTDAAPVRA